MQVHAAAPDLGGQPARGHERVDARRARARARALGEVQGLNVHRRVPAHGLERVGSVRVVELVEQLAALPTAVSSKQAADLVAYFLSVFGRGGNALSA